MAKLRVAVRGGHSEASTGSVALLNELKEDRKVKNAVIKYLRELGCEVYDVTPPESYKYPAELNYGINQANKLEVDLFVSIHFNKAYNSYNGAIGSEVLVFNKNPYGERVIKGLADLGFKNRGQKVRPRKLAELESTNMTALIVEVCFVEATKDVELYKKLGPDAIGKKIAESIANKKAVSKPSTPSKPAEPSKPSTSNLYRVRKSWKDTSSQKGAYSNLDNAIAECKKHSGYKVYDEDGKQVYPKVEAPKPSTPKPSGNNWKLVKQNGVCTWNTAVQIREQPSTKSKSVGQYNKGQKVTYDYYVDNEGYRWISWIGGSGKRRYAAVRVLSNNKKYGNCV